MTQNYDFLGIGDNSQFENERVLLSTEIYAFCGDIEPIPCHLIVTQSAVFVTKNEFVQRRICLLEIDSLTVSSNSHEFVLHGAETPDDRFSCLKNKSAVLRMIVYLKTTKHPADSPAHNEKIKVYFVPDLSLDIYVTTDQDIEEGHLIRPDDKYAHLVTYKEFLDLDQRRIEKKEAKSRSMRTLFSNDVSRNYTIDDFELLKTLGRGAHGKVILCRKRNGKGELYAMKVIKKQHIIDTNHITHTVAEKNILSGMHHPFLVSLRHAFQSDRKIYFVMEFMKGGELFQHLRKVKRFTEPQVRFFAACVVMALGHLHNKDYIYRDLKPENVLLDEKGYAMLTDFGLAKYLQVNDVAKTFCGTPEYMAPEIILNKGCNRQADWWGLGILVYELLVGRPPFYDENVQEMYTKTLIKQPRFPSRLIVSAEAKDFIIGLLQKNAEKRLGSIADSLEIMNHPWFKSFNWGKLLEKTLPAPYTPDIKNWEHNFDPESMKDRPIDSFCVVDPALVKKFENQFKVFDYNSSTDPKDDKADLSPVRSSPSLLKFWKAEDDAGAHSNDDSVEKEQNSEADTPDKEKSKQKAKTVPLGRETAQETHTPDSGSTGVKTPVNNDQANAEEDYDDEEVILTHTV